MNPNLRRVKYWSIQARHGLEEVRLVRSVRDLGILYDKFLFIRRRTARANYNVDSIPPGIQIEPTNYCNARCICCSTVRSPRKRGFMEFDLFSKIIEDARRNNMRIVHLYLHGEPTLHPRIVEMIACVKQHGLSVHLTTNGMLLTRDKQIAILNSGVDLSDHFTFSMLGYSPEVHERVMGRVSHAKVVENIDSFLALRKERRTGGPIIETIFYPMPENQHEAPDYLRAFTNYVDHARIASRISLSFANHNTKEGVPLPTPKRSCTHLRERLTVFWNGDVPICLHDLDGEQILGNLARNSIREICRNEELLRVRSAHANGRLETILRCSTCDM